MCWLSSEVHEQCCLDLDGPCVSAHGGKDKASARAEANARTPYYCAKLCPSFFFIPAQFLHRECAENVTRGMARVGRKGKDQRYA